MRRREATKQSVIALVIVLRSHVKPKLYDMGECMSVSNEALIGEAAHLLQGPIVVDMVMHAGTSLWSEPRDFGYYPTTFAKKRHIWRHICMLLFRFALESQAELPSFPSLGGKCRRLHEAPARRW